ncbi:hypothetical protein [Nocardia sp. alder85J]|uniref:hypothetical protein n=1 Tax=Nocardia sp. alder85J TaxID=2862949 RepID=UPI001CD7A0F1|nr:hypothetical protein [Nocardia sp. alder85J]MCX4095334.1 hypothetical protein [Nocardia sp. alder85J]
MLRAKRSTTRTHFDGVRAIVIEAAERRVARLREACHDDVRQIYDFRPELECRERELEELRAGKPARIRRALLPAEVTAGWRGARFFLVYGDGAVEPAPDA